MRLKRRGSSSTSGSIFPQLLATTTTKHQCLQRGRETLEHVEGRRQVGQPHHQLISHLNRQIRPGVRWVGEVIRGLAVGSQLTGTNSSFPSESDMADPRPTSRD